MIRLIATDLDGTLLEKNGTLPEGFFDVARGLLDMGIAVAAASGRQYDNLRRMFFPIAGEMSSSAKTADSAPPAGRLWPPLPWRKSWCWKLPGICIPLASGS